MKQERESCLFHQKGQPGRVVRQDLLAGVVLFTRGRILDEGDRQLCGRAVREFPDGLAQPLGALRLEILCKATAFMLPRRVVEAWLAQKTGRAIYC